VFLSEPDEKEVQGAKWLNAERECSKKGEFLAEAAQRFPSISKRRSVKLSGDGDMPTCQKNPVLRERGPKGHWRAMAK